MVRFEFHIPDFTLITQNVDGFHRLAGSEKVVELHGNIQHNRCSVEGHLIEGPAAPAAPGGPPACPHCGAAVRPAVVWFGESLPPEALAVATKAAEQAQIFFSIGTSALVAPAASLPVLARQRGAILVEINPQPTALTLQADYVLQGPAGTVLPALVNQTWKE
jgi:NAD-dependent deacetylase